MLTSAGPSAAAGAGRVGVEGGGVLFGGVQAGQLVREMLQGVPALGGGVRRRRDTLLGGLDGVRAPPQVAVRPQHLLCRPGATNISLRTIGQLQKLPSLQKAAIGRHRSEAATHAGRKVPVLKPCRAPIALD